MGGEPDIDPDPDTDTETDEGPDSDTDPDTDADKPPRSNALPPSVSLNHYSIKNCYVSKDNLKFNLK